MQAERNTNRHVALIGQPLALPWVFDEAARRGIDLTLVPPTGTRVDRAPAGVVQVLDLDIVDGYEAAMRALLARHAERAFDGVATLREPAVPFTADLAERLGLPGLGRATAHAARNKVQMRRRFQAAGLNCPRFVSIDLDSSLDASAAHALTFPVVVKPAAGFSSQGVSRVDRVEDLATSLRQVQAIVARELRGLAGPGHLRCSGAVVEEFIDGPEYAVETFAVGGRVEILAVGYKGNLRGPYFEEGIHVTEAPLPEETRRAISDEVRRATLALGITDGPTHTELRLRGGCTPYVLEVGARVGGSGVSHFLVSRSRGISLAGLVLEQATGADVRAELATNPPDPPVTASNYIVPCQGTGIITAIRGLDEVRALSATKHVCQFMFPGDFVPPQPAFAGYPAFILSEHASYAEARDFHAQLDHLIRIDYAPAPARST